VTRRSRYKRWVLIEEFKREINTIIKRKLIEVERSLMLQSILPGYSMKKGKGYNNTIGCAVVVSVSALCSRYYNFA